VRLEVGNLKSECGPVVVPKERDYAAAQMRKWEKKEVGSRNAEGGKKEGGKLRRWEVETGSGKLDPSSSLEGGTMPRQAGGNGKSEVGCLTNIIKRCIFNII
jgi:hypothetical protein